jgi:hypothetical protein
MFTRSKGSSEEDPALALVLGESDSVITDSYNSGSDESEINIANTTGILVDLSKTLRGSILDTINIKITNKKELLRHQLLMAAKRFYSK